jgi:hypothetical protein
VVIETLHWVVILTVVLSEAILGAAVRAPQRLWRSVRAALPVAAGFLLDCVVALAYVFVTGLIGLGLISMALVRGASVTGWVVAVDGPAAVAHWLLVLTVAAIDMTDHAVERLARSAYWTVHEKVALEWRRF